MESVRVFEVRECNEEYLVAVNCLLGQLSTKECVLSRDDFENLVSSDTSHLFLLLYGSAIVGMLCVCVCACVTGRKAWIEDVVVDTEFRGKAFGKLLVNYAMDYVKSLGNVTVMLTSRPSRIAANALYRSVGFETKETNVYIKKI